MPSNNLHNTTIEGNDPFANRMKEALGFAATAGISQEEAAPEDELQRIIQNWGEELKQQMVSNLLKNKTNASGTLASSITNILQKTRNGYILETQAENYANFVEYGRKAGKRPPVEAIIRYIQEKREIQQSSIIRDAKNRIQATKSLAFAIANKIGASGTKKQPFIVPALKKVTTQILAQRIGEYMARE